MIYIYVNIYLISVIPTRFLKLQNQKIDIKQGFIEINFEFEMEFRQILSYVINTIKMHNSCLGTISVSHRVQKIYGFSIKISQVRYLSL